MRKLQEGSLCIAIALYFICYCSWGNPSSAFVRVLGTSKMLGRQNSRGRLSLNAYTGRTPNEAPKTDAGKLFIKFLVLSS